LLKKSFERKWSLLTQRVVETPRNYNLDMRSAAFIFAVSKEIEILTARYLPLIWKSDKR
jgi:hypothetical protein